MEPYVYIVEFSKFLKEHGYSDKANLLVWYGKNKIEPNPRNVIHSSYAKKCIKTLKTNLIKYLKSKGINPGSFFDKPILKLFDKFYEKGMFPKMYVVHHSENGELGEFFKNFADHFHANAKEICLKFDQIAPADDPSQEVQNQISEAPFNKEAIDIVSYAIEYSDTNSETPKPTVSVYQFTEFLKKYSYYQKDQLNFWYGESFVSPDKRNLIKSYHNQDILYDIKHAIQEYLRNKNISLGSDFKKPILVLFDKFYDKGLLPKSIISTYRKGDELPEFFKNFADHFHANAKQICLRFDHEIVVLNDEEQIHSTVLINPIKAFSQFLECHGYMSPKNMDDWYNSTHVQPNLQNVADSTNFLPSVLSIDVDHMQICVCIDHPEPYIIRGMNRAFTQAHQNIHPMRRAAEQQVLQVTKLFLKYYHNGFIPSYVFTGSNLYPKPQEFIKNFFKYFRYKAKRVFDDWDELDNASNQNTGSSDGSIQNSLDQYVDMGSFEYEVAETVSVSPYKIREKNYQKYLKKKSEAIRQQSKQQNQQLHKAAKQVSFQYDISASQLLSTEVIRFQNFLAQNLGQANSEGRVIAFPQQTQQLAATGTGGAVHSGGYSSNQPRLHTGTNKQGKIIQLHPNKPRFSFNSSKLMAFNQSGAPFMVGMPLVEMISYAITSDAKFAKYASELSALPIGTGMWFFHYNTVTNGALMTSTKLAGNALIKSMTRAYKPLAAAAMIVSPFMIFGKLNQLRAAGEVQNQQMVSDIVNGQSSFELKSPMPVITDAEYNQFNGLLYGDKLYKKELINEARFRSYADYHKAMDQLVLIDFFKQAINVYRSGKVTNAKFERLFTNEMKKNVKGFETELVKSEDKFKLIGQNAYDYLKQSYPKTEVKELQYQPVSVDVYEPNHKTKNDPFAQLLEW